MASGTTTFTHVVFGLTPEFLEFIDDRLDKDSSYYLFKNLELDHSRAVLLQEVFYETFPRAAKRTDTPQRPMRVLDRDGWEAWKQADTLSNTLVTLFFQIYPHLYSMQMGDIDSILELMLQNKVYYHSQMGPPSYDPKLFIGETTVESSRELIIADCMRRYLTNLLPRLRPIQIIPTPLPKLRSRNIAVISPVGMGLGHFKPAQALSKFFSSKGFPLLHVRYDSEIRAEGTLHTMFRSVADFNPALIVSTAFCHAYRIDMLALQKITHAHLIFVNTDFADKMHETPIHFPPDPMITIGYPSDTLYAPFFGELTPLPSDTRAALLGFPIGEEIENPPSEGELVALKETLGILEGYESVLLSVSDYDMTTTSALIDMLSQLNRDPTPCTRKRHLIINMRSINGTSGSRHTKQVIDTLSPFLVGENLYQIGELRITLIGPQKSLGPLYHLCDTIIAKPGGSTVAEMLHMRAHFSKSLACVDPSTFTKDGCEKSNAGFLTSHKVAHHFTNHTELLAIVLGAVDAPCETLPVPDWKSAYLARALAAIEDATPDTARAGR